MRMRRTTVRDKIKTVDQELKSYLDGKFSAINGKADANDRRLDAIDGRFDAIDRRFDAIDGRLDAIDGRLDAMDGKFVELENRLIEKMRDMQTELLRGFESIASAQTIRLRKVEADQSNLDTSVRGRLDIVENRLLQIELRLGKSTGT
jgi:hypothetical protein